MAADLACPFCLRQLPASFDPLPLVLPCCGRFGCASCVRPLVESSDMPVLLQVAQPAGGGNYLVEMEAQSGPRG